MNIKSMTYKSHKYDVKVIVIIVQKKWNYDILSHLRDENLNSVEVNYNINQNYNL